MVIGRPLTGYRNAFKITKVGEPFDANGVIRRFVIPGPGDVFVYDHQ